MATTQERTDEVLYEVSEGIATLTLNRPDRLNTISGPMLNQLTALLVQANEDPEVRVVILTGTGKAFCAGLDLVSLVSLDTECAVPGLKCARSSDNQWWPASLKAGYGGLCSKLATTPD